MRAAGEAAINTCVSKGRRPRPAGSKVTPGARSPVPREERAEDRPALLLRARGGVRRGVPSLASVSFRSVRVAST